jgi:glycogen synthase
MDDRKGVHVAIEALAQLPPEATLVLQGSGDERYVERLRALTRELGAQERVRFERRPRAELPELFGESDAVVFPVQWEEPWGLVPLEAMASGRPVVATGTGGSGEYLRHGENCLLYSPRDSADELAAAVKRLGADEQLRARLVAGGSGTAPRYTERAYNEEIAAALLEAAGP